MSHRRARLCTWSEPVHDEWIDYNGHLSEPYYVLVLGHATDAVMDAVGLGPAYRAAHRRLALHGRGARPLPRRGLGRASSLEVRSWVIGATAKLLWIWHELWAGGTLRATEEILGVHVDSSSASSAPFPDEVAAFVQQRRVPPGPDASRSIRVG